jgi:hypothetical protein
LGAFPFFALRAKKGNRAIRLYLFGLRPKRIPLLSLARTKTLTGFPALSRYDGANRQWTCSTTRLVVSQVSQIWRISYRNPPNLLFFSGSCLITEVIEQL